MNDGHETRLVDLKGDPSYKAKATPAIVQVPEMLFVMVDGEGSPEGNGSDFQIAMQVLFGVAYTIKFWARKHVMPRGYTGFTMAPPEVLWWTKSGRAFDKKRPDDWRWTAMIRVPEFVSPSFFQQVIDDCVLQKRSSTFARARLKHHAAGTCVQVMHTGPYDQEDVSMQRLRAFARETGHVLTGKHHEIYLNAPQRTAPEKLRTIVRHSVRKM